MGFTLERIAQHRADGTARPCGCPPRNHCCLSADNPDGHLCDCDLRDAHPNLGDALRELAREQANDDWDGWRNPRHARQWVALVTYEPYDEHPDREIVGPFVDADAARAWSDARDLGNPDRETRTLITPMWQPCLGEGS